MITIELPFPDRVLSPNSRKHWAVKARAVAKAKEDAYWIAASEYKVQSILKQCNTGELRCTWTFHPPKDKRRRWDDDNLVAAMKSARDGVCDALGIDDSQIKETVSRFGDVDRPDGRVVMTLEAM